MKLDKTIRYSCNYKKQTWECKMKNISKNHEITSFTICGRSSEYKVHLIQLNKRSWIDIPEIGISSQLSSLQDVFWNSEKIGYVMNSIIDGIMIAEALKIISEL